MSHRRRDHPNNETTRPEGHAHPNHRRRTTPTTHPSDPPPVGDDGLGEDDCQDPAMGLDRAVLFRLATSDRLERAAKAVPGGGSAAWRAASRYVAGRTRAEALTTATAVLEQGSCVSVDLFGELVTDLAVATDVVEEYLSLVAALPAPPAQAWLSVDLSHLALDVDPAGTADRLATIAGALPPGR